MYVLNYRGHCLMGQLYESLGELEKAVASYRRYQLVCCCSCSYIVSSLPPRFLAIIIILVIKWLMRYFLGPWN